MSAPAVLTPCRRCGNGPYHPAHHWSEHGDIDVEPCPAYLGPVPAHLRVPTWDLGLKTVEKARQSTASARPTAPRSGLSVMADALLGEMLDSADLDGIPALEPIISGLLYRDTPARVYGESESLKSFIAIDFAGCVGTGMDWHGRHTRQGLVVYIVAEGGRGVRPRVRAWEQYHGRKMTGVKFLTRPVQATSPEWGALVEACELLQPSLIVVDTQARVTVGVEENSAREMGVFIDQVERLRAASGACVLLVHHSGHNGSHGRGSSSVRGAMQTELAVARKGKKTENAWVTMSVAKQKDADRLADVTFQAQVVEVEGEFDEEGRPVTSVVLVPAIRTEDVVLVEPDSADDIVYRLDAAGVPRGLGRDRLKEECQRLGIKASTAKLARVARLRKAVAPEPVPGPVLPASNKSPAKPVPDRGTGQEVTPGQTCPGQVQDR